MLSVLIVPDLGVRISLLVDGCEFRGKISLESTIMENPASWSNTQKAINEIISQNQESALLSYELVSKLKSKKLLSQKVDEEELVAAFDQAIWEHEDAVKRHTGQAFVSLVTKLSNVLTKHTG